MKRPAARLDFGDQHARVGEILVLSEVTPEHVEIVHATQQILTAFEDLHEALRR